MLQSPRTRTSPHKNQKQNQSSLPQEIITDILTRLKAKPLTRFESVSKQFSALIKSPHFVDAHLRRSSRRPSLLVQRRRRGHASDSGLSLLRDEETLALGDDLQIPFVNAPYRDPRVVGFCDGLLCVDVYSGNIWRPHRFVFWNPATRRFIFVPSPQIEETLSPPPPGYCTMTVGLGFGVCDTVKLVRIVCFESVESGAEEEVAVTRAEVFAAGRRNGGYWREIKVGIEPFSVGESERSVRVNGALHWTACGAGELSGREFIVFFDMAYEVFGKMPMPGSDVWSYRTCRELVEFKGNLGLFVYPRIGNLSSQFEFWVMNDGGGGGVELWNKVCTIGPFSRIARPMVVWRDSEIVLRSMERYNGGLFSCDSNSKDTKDLPSYGADFQYEVYSYVESLLGWDEMVEAAPS